MSRKVVSRPLEMLKIRGDIGFKIFQHIFPILMAKDRGQMYRVELAKLIGLLGLPDASWHKYRSRRKEVFSKAIKELNGMKGTDDRYIEIKIEEGKNKSDFLLISKLLNYESPTKV